MLLRNHSDYLSRLMSISQRKQKQSKPRLDSLGARSKNKANNDSLGVLPWFCFPRWQRAALIPTLGKGGLPFVHGFFVPANVFFFFGGGFPTNGCCPFGFPLKLPRKGGTRHGEDSEGGHPSATLTLHGTGTQVLGLGIT